MDEIRIDSRKKRIAIRDEDDQIVGEIAFNPYDVTFAERFYEIFQEFSAKQKEYEARAEQLDAANAEVDQNGLPWKFDQGIAFLREVCEFMYEKIDRLFGEGTSTVVFRGSLNIDMIGQFFEGITPFIEQARSEKIDKYSNKQTGKVLK